MTARLEAGVLYEGVASDGVSYPAAIAHAMASVRADLASSDDVVAVFYLQAEMERLRDRLAERARLSHHRASHAAAVGNPDLAARLRSLRDLERAARSELTEALRLMRIVYRLSPRPALQFRRGPVARLEAILAR